MEHKRLPWCLEEVLVVWRLALLDIDILVSEFELQSRYYVQSQTNILGKGLKFLIFQATA